MPFPIVPAGPGVLRQVLAESPEMMLVSVRFEAGAEGARHSHPHAQTSFVAAGLFDYEVAGSVRRIGPGEGVVIPPGAEHGCVCVEAGELIDSFAPRRDDFL